MSSTWLTSTVNQRQRQTAVGFNETQQNSFVTPQLASPTLEDNWTKGLKRAQYLHLLYINKYDSYTPYWPTDKCVSKHHCSFIVIFLMGHVHFFNPKKRIHLIESVCSHFCASCEVEVLSVEAELVRIWPARQQDVHIQVALVLLFLFDSGEVLSDRLVHHQVGLEESDADGDQITKVIANCFKLSPHRPN